MADFLPDWAKSRGAATQTAIGDDPAQWPRTSSAFEHLCHLVKVEVGDEVGDDVKSNVADLLGRIGLQLHTDPTARTRAFGEFSRGERSLLALGRVLVQAPATTAAAVAAIAQGQNHDNGRCSVGTAHIAIDEVTGA